MKPRFATWAARLLLALLAGLVLLVALEVALRLAPPAPRAGRRRDRPAIQFYPSDARLHPWSRNHPDPLRIAVVGDSITQGTGCQFYDTYGMRLEALLNLNDGQRPAAVRVWAKGGESTDLEVRHLKSIVPWKPELLILGICLNDAENAWKKEEYSRWRIQALPAPPSPRLARWLRHTRAGMWIYQRIANRKAQRGYRAYYRKLYDPNYSGWKLFVRAIRTFHETCRQNGIAFVPVIFPSFGDLDRYPFDWVHEQIAEVLRTEGVRFLDLREAFRGQSSLRLQVIPFVDSHPNEIAHRQAAESIFQFLLANQLVDAGYVPQHATASPERMWQVLGGFIHNVVAMDADWLDQLIEPNHEVDIRPP